MEVRRLRADEADSWRDIRLRMLGDAPSAFGMTHEDALATPADEWARRAEAFAAGETRVVYIAEDGGEFVGSAGAFLDPEDQDLPHLWGMWVAPAARGKGVGRALIEAVYDRARQAGSSRVYWQTHETNLTAIKLYERVAERSGFIVYRKPL